MITTLGLITDIYEAVQDFNLGSSLSCTPCTNVYKLERPINSITEDIVIGALPITGGVIQYCTVNFNIHVPDIKISTGSPHVRPNTVRLKQLADLYSNFFEYLTLSGCEITVENQSVFKGEKDHYVNIRLSVRIFN